VVVLLPGELFAEGLDVLQEVVDGLGEGELGFRFVEDFDPGLRGFEFEALLALGLQRLGGGLARSFSFAALRQPFSVRTCRKMFTRPIRKRTKSGRYFGR
jgi:hypothetical protein